MSIVGAASRRSGNPKRTRSFIDRTPSTMRGGNPNSTPDGSRTSPGRFPQFSRIPRGNPWPRDAVSPSLPSASLRSRRSLVSTSSPNRSPIARWGRRRCPDEAIMDEQVQVRSHAKSIMPSTCGAAGTGSLLQRFSILSPSASSRESHGDLAGQACAKPLPPCRAASQLEHLDCILRLWH